MALLPSKKLQQKTPRVSLSTVSQSSILPSSAISRFSDTLVKVRKAAIIFSGLALAVDEISYLLQREADFDGFDFNALSIKAWRRVREVAKLRQSLTRTRLSPVDFLKCANSSAANAGDLASYKTQSTARRVDQIFWLISRDRFNTLSPNSFKDETNLRRLQTVTVVADKVGVSPDKLFVWARPMARFWPSREIAEEIRKVIMSRYTITDWQVAINAASDKLTQNQSQALSSYVIVQPGLVNAGAVDADSLFELSLLTLRYVHVWRSLR